MWIKKELKNVITLMWGFDNDDDIYVEHALSYVTPELYEILTLNYGIPRGAIKDMTVYDWEWEQQVS